MNGSRPPTASKRPTASNHLVTPDGRYFIVRGRLWRMSDPGLDPAVREELVVELMVARRAIAAAKRAADARGKAEARKTVDRVKRKLGERGPVWWKDGSPDFNRHMVNRTPYAEWWADIAGVYGAT